MSSDAENGIGTAAMSADGVLTIHLNASPRGEAPEIIRPSDADYQQMIMSVGGIKPGERKIIPESIGTVTMASDGTITYALHGIESAGPQFRMTGKSKLGDADYASWLTRVGGLRPGETKLVPAR